MREHKPKTLFYDLISLKLNNKNEIRYKPINKNLTINDGLRYLIIKQKKRRRSSKRRNLLLLTLSSKIKNVRYFSQSRLSEKSSATQSPKKRAF